MVDQKIWMVQGAKERAEWFLAHMRNRPEEQALFEKIRGSMVGLAVPDGEGGRQDGAPGASGGGNGNDGRGRPLKEKPLRSKSGTSMPSNKNGHWLKKTWSADCSMRKMRYEGDKLVP